MSYTYIDQHTGESVTTTHKAHGNVTFRMREKIIATHHDDNVQALEAWAHTYLDKLDCILSREDFYQVSFHIAFGYSPEHRYTENIK